MSEKPEHNPAIDKKTTMPLFVAASVFFTGISLSIAGAWQAANYSSRILTRLDAMERRCWTVDDMLEWTEQAKVTLGSNGVPEIYRVMKTSRNNKEDK